MKIVFVYPNLTRLERVTLGLGYVASYVQRRGHECRLVDYTWGGGYEKTIDAVRETGYNDGYADNLSLIITAE